MLSISKGVSAKSLEMLIDNVKNYKPLIALAFITMFNLFRVKKVSKILLFLFCIIITVMTFNIFLESYDKFILIYNFIYLLSSYYFYSLLTLEMKEAVYEPGYRSNQIGDRRSYNIKVTIEGKAFKTLEGKITNWNKGSCFIALDEKPQSISGKVNIVFEYENREFEQVGQVVTSYENGFGIKFIEVENSAKHDWSSFYAIIHDRGYSI